MPGDVEAIVCDKLHGELDRDDGRAANFSREELDGGGGGVGR